MKPILDTTSGRGNVKPRGQTAGVILLLLLGLGVARADFTGEFKEAFWTNTPSGAGSVYFTNSDTELVLTGPFKPAAAIPLSLDGIQYNGPLSGGLTVGGTLEFNYTFNPGDAQSDSEAQIGWTPPGSDATSQNALLGQAGLGPSQGFFSTNLLAGTTFQFFLTTDTLALKSSATLIITDFQFLPIPEPSTGALLGSVLVSLGAARWRRAQRRASRLP